MIAEITPPPLEVRYVHVWIWARTAAYLAGLVIGTTAIGTLAGEIGTIAPVNIGMDAGSIWVEWIAVTSVAYGLHEFEIVRLPVPQHYWQVPSDWARFGKIGQQFMYGLVLGVEVLTLIPYATFYILMLFELALGLKGGALVGLIYGLARAIPTIAGVAASVRFANNTPVMMIILRARSMFHRANGVMLITVGIVLLGGRWFG